VGIVRFCTHESRDQMGGCERCGGWEKDEGVDGVEVYVVPEGEVRMCGYKGSLEGCGRASCRRAAEQRRLAVGSETDWDGDGEGGKRKEGNAEKNGNRGLLGLEGGSEEKPTKSRGKAGGLVGGYGLPGIVESIKEDDPGVSDYQDLGPCEDNSGVENTKEDTESDSEVNSESWQDGISDSLELNDREKGVLDDNASEENLAAKQASTIEGNVGSDLNFLRPASETTITAAELHKTEEENDTDSKCKGEFVDTDEDSDEEEIFDDVEVREPCFDCDWCRMEE